MRMIVSGIMMSGLSRSPPSSVPLRKPVKFIGPRLGRPRRHPRETQSTELRQPGGGFGRPASQPPSHLAGHLASHPASHHCFVHACLPHRPCSQDLKMMSPIHGVCGKISFPLNKAHHAWGWGFGLFARVVHDDMPVAHENYQGYYVLTQKVYDFVLGYMSRNEELET